MVEGLIKEKYIWDAVVKTMVEGYGVVKNGRVEVEM